MTDVQTVRIPTEGPYGTSTSAFVLRNGAGDAIRGAVHESPVGAVAPRRPVILAVAGFGETMRSTLSASLDLLGGGFTVIRFDPTNSVGFSDGDISAFNINRVVTDIHDVAEWAREHFGPVRLGLFGNSLSARAGVRAAALRPDLFRIVGTLACVADMTKTLRAVTGATSDAEGARILAGGGDGAVDLLGHRLDALSVEHGIADWLTPGSVAADITRAPGTRFVNVHGGLDAWCDAGDARTVFAHGNARVEVDPAMAHYFDREGRARAMAVLLPEFHDALRAGAPRPHVAIGATPQEFVQIKQIDRDIAVELAAAESIGKVEVAV